MTNNKEVMDEQMDDGSGSDNQEIDYQYDQNQASYAGNEIS